ncbi:MAG TPA: HEAT repeat domain-containing protein, partial [Byssovorax sp.]
MSAAAGLGLSERDRGRLEEIEEIARGEDVAPLVAALDEPSWVVRRGVVAALARAGDAALGPVVEVLRSARGHEGRLAAAVDALVASRGAVEAAMFALLREDPPAVVICDVAQILGRRKSEGALEALGAMALHEDDNVAIAAIEALGRIGGPGTCAALVAAVACRSFFRTFPAIRALGATGDARAVAPLASLLDDPLYALDAVIALGETGREEAIAPLLVLLDASDAALVRAAAGALVELDHRAQVGAACPRPAARVRAHAAARGSVRSLGAALQQADDAAAVRVARVLGWVADDAAIAILFELLARDGAVAAAASSALRDAGPRVEARLGAALSAGGSATRRRLLPLVGALAVDREVIAACLDDDDAAVRALACEAWARTGEARDVSRLFSRVSDADAYVAQAASAAVQALGGAEIRALALRGARSTDARTRRASLRVVGYFGDPEALPVLRAAIGDVDPRVAEAALVGLSLVGEAEATAAIVAAAAHASPKIRAAAARALGGTSRTDGVVGALTRGLDDADAWTRYYACRSLGRLGVTAAADAIALRLEDAAGQVRVAAVEALATLGGEVAARALAGAAAFGDADARRAALVGLGMAHRDESLATVNDAVMSTDVATRL